MIDYKLEYEKWLNDPVFDEETKAELRALTDQKEIEDRFYKELSFGTGGLRGVIGAGTNRMNLYTVGKASQGLANFILKSGEENKSVAIAYDSRNMSKEFALASALIFAGNGIKAYLFDDLRPTPMLSFAVRHLKTTAGIVITASHNPPEYNGYKVYWKDGGQIVPPYDKWIIDEVNAVKDYSLIVKISKEEALEKGLLVIIGKEVDDEYIKEVKRNVLCPEVIKGQAEDIKIVYTPLNGAGRVPVLRVLDELGFKKVWTVQEQEMPDGNFKTLKYPNPEDPEAFSYALRLGKRVDADIIMATDPDADRLGIYAYDNENKSYIPFTGNMSGLLIAEYQLSIKREKGLLPKESGTGAIVTTVVSSNMAKEIAKEYDLTLIETLTGFKYIGEQIKLFEEAKEKNGGKYSKKANAYEYLFGYEESYGCLVGIHARDKDAVMAVTALAEAAAYYKSKGLTLVDQMKKMYEKYGYYKEGLSTKVLKGADGADKIKAIMDELRKTPLTNIGEDKVLAVRDYKIDERIDLVSGKKERTGLPSSNVLYYELEGDGWCCVRPSGTEPKIKFYYGVKAKDIASAEKKIADKERELFEITDK